MAEAERAKVRHADGVRKGGQTGGRGRPNSSPQNSGESKKKKSRANETSHRIADKANVSHATVARAERRLGDLFAPRAVCGPSHRDIQSAENSAD